MGIDAIGRFTFVFQDKSANQSERKGWICFCTVRDVVLAGF
jgi:hypothetical protein